MQFFNNSGVSYGPLPQRDNVFSDLQFVEPLEDEEAVVSKNKEEERLLKEIDADKNKITCIEEDLEQVRKMMEEAQKYWNDRIEEMENTISQRREAIISNQQLLDTLCDSATAEEEEAPPGPSCLLCLDGNVCTAIVGFVILANIVSMVLEITHPEKRATLKYFEHACLLFYLVELTLKAILFQNRLLVGPCVRVWWNWLDLLIVLVGIVDQWLSPLWMMYHHNSERSSGHTSFLQFIRVLRVARLARILKIVRLFLDSDVSWAERNKFQAFIMGVIAANCLIMSFETDYPDFFLWFYVEQALLLIFSFELLVRLKLWGWAYFTNRRDLVWNLLDFVIVVGGIVDQWLMPVLQFVETLLGMPSQERNGGMGQVMVMLRMARLLRVLRLVRLVRNVPPLFTLIVGIVQAMQGMMWVLVLTIVLLYVFALLAVKLIGRGMIFGGEHNVPPEVANIFPSVLESMFNLFMAMNGDPEYLSPLFHVMPAFRLFFVIYMVLSSWAILSILTAVVSENMISATETNKEETEKEERELAWTEAVKRIKTIATAADTDNDGELDGEEFQSMLSDDKCAEELRKAAKCDSIEDLRNAYQDLCLISDGGDGAAIGLKELIAALHDNDQPVRRKDAVILEKRLAVLEKTLNRVEKAIVPGPASATSRTNHSGSNGVLRPALPARPSLSRVSMESHSPLMHLSSGIPSPVSETEVS